jgi:hypothetical protein
MSQCPSCGGDCGYLKNKGCQYGKKTLPDMLTQQEHQEILRIVARWDYATEAAIEAYLLGKKLSDNVAQAYLKGFDEASSQHGCAECGIGGGHALYCVPCAEKFVGGYKENVPVHTSELLTQVSTDTQYAGNGTAGIQNETKPTGFFFQMPTKHIAEEDDDIPPQRTWVGLTDEETRGCIEATIEITDLLLLDAVNAVIVDVERLLREKNT